MKTENKSERLDKLNFAVVSAILPVTGCIGQIIASGTGKGLPSLILTALPILLLILALILEAPLKQFVFLGVSSIIMYSIIFIL